MLMRVGRDQKASAEPGDKQREWRNSQSTTEQALTRAADQEVRWERSRFVF